MDARPIRLITSATAAGLFSGQSGYVRLERSDGLLLWEAQTPPDPAMSTRAEFVPPISADGGVVMRTVNAVCLPVIVER